jgi:hypothetical protein
VQISASALATVKSFHRHSLEQRHNTNIADIAVRNETERGLANGLQHQQLSANIYIFYFFFQDVSVTCVVCVCLCANGNASQCCAKLEDTQSWTKYVWRVLLVGSASKLLQTPGLSYFIQETVNQLFEAGYAKFSNAYDSFIRLRSDDTTAILTKEQFNPPNFGRKHVMAAAQAYSPWAAHALSELIDENIRSTCAISIDHTFKFASNTFKRTAFGKRKRVTQQLVGVINQDSRILALEYVTSTGMQDLKPIVKPILEQMKQNGAVLEVMSVDTVKGFKNFRVWVESQRG